MSDHFFDCDFLRQNAGWKNYRHLGIILHNFLRSKILDSRSAAERNDFYALLVLEALLKVSCTNMPHTEGSCLMRLFGPGKSCTSQKPRYQDF